ncbi:MAG: molybdate ABC transporter permease subunit [Acidobacteriaceae bacterium]|nr:molybdate ABC transporter permease subunit [Acidobacteriaceae bacterium]
MDFTALSLTIRLAAQSTLLLLLLTMPLAAWLAAGTGITRRVVQAAVALPMVLPPTVLGFYLLTGLGPATAFGRAIIVLLGHPLAFTFPGIVFGSMLYSLPFAVQPLTAAFDAVPHALTDTARVLGASPFTVFRRVTLPLAKSGILTAAVLTFAHTVGEFGVVLMLGGDIPGKTQTLSVSIYDKVQEGNYAAANTMSLWLLAASFLALLAVYLRSDVLRRRPKLG